MHSSPTIVTAAMLAIGDELLSGRTKDKNISYLAEELTKAGIELGEVRIVPDKQQAIVNAVNALRTQYDYLFTSGGIGPTHDDITAVSIAEALNLPCIFDAQAEKILSEYYRVKKPAIYTGAPFDDPHAGKSETYCKPAQRRAGILH